MKNIALHYFCKRDNFGDLLNVEICKYFGDTCTYAEPEVAEASFLGSMLHYHLRDWSKEEQPVSNEPLHIWGTGFIASYEEWAGWHNFNPNEHPEYFTREPHFHAVRGKLTRDRLENMLGIKLDGLLLADPGILANLLVKPEPKKYDLGVIISHTDNIDNDVFYTLPADSILINTNTTDVLGTLKLISSCRFIVSSAMHGCIVADSFGIPNARLVTKRLHGGDYKWNDYYSAYGMTLDDTLTYVRQGCEYEDLTGNYRVVGSLDVSLADIELAYKIPHDAIMCKQLGLLSTYPYQQKEIINED